MANCHSGEWGGIFVQGSHCYGKDGVSPYSHADVLVPKASEREALEMSFKERLT